MAVEVGRSQPAAMAFDDHNGERFGGIIRCGRARARSVVVIARAWFRTPEEYSRFGRITGRWLKITALEPAPAIF
jgi:hypothetical protein